MDATHDPRRTFTLATILALVLLSTLACGTSHSQTLQAEAATLTGGAGFANDHPGYTGSGFVGGFVDSNRGTARVTFQVTAASTTEHRLSLRYANGTTLPKTLSLYVDGTRRQQVTLPATANWDSWAVLDLQASLSAGSRAVAFAFDATDSGNVNLDALTVSALTVDPPTRGLLQAEAAQLSGGAIVASDHSGYTGAGFVAGYTDSNRGTANTLFTTSVENGGQSTLTLRYSNGTGSAKTVSLYVNGVWQQLTLPATAHWDAWATLNVPTNLVSGTNRFEIRFGVNDTGNVNLDSLSYTPPSTDPDPEPTSGSYEAEAAFHSNGPAVASSITGFSGGGYLTSFGQVGARAIFATHLNSAGNASIVVRFQNPSGTAQSLSLYANTTRVGQISLASGAGWQTVSQTVALRRGLNVIGLQRDNADVANSVAVDRIEVSNTAAMAARGATLPYRTYEAESGSTNGTRLQPDRTYLTLASEASGRSAVQLRTTGEYVQFTLNEPANALAIRYSIPDTANGAGSNATLSLYTNGTKVRTLQLTSRYAWVYGSYPYDNNPAGGAAHHFFDESHFLIANYPQGTVLKLQKDAGDTAASYTIDLIDAEQVAPAEAMPAGYISATSHGATAGDGTDDTQAIRAAIAAASASGQGVWIPSGTFNINARINVANVRIKGAGPWHSIVQGVNGKGGFFATGDNVVLSDFQISGDVTYRDDANFDAAVEGNFGSGSVLFNLWMRHVKVGMWIDSGTQGLYAVGLRIRDTFADGVNLHANVHDTRVEQSSIRNTGDDALAMWSDGQPVTNSAFSFNTVQLPMLANAVGIYGGASNRVTDNLLSDTVVASVGIAISTRFNPVPFSGTTLVARNTLTRTGGYEHNWQTALGALWIYTDVHDISTPVVVQDTQILDSTYQGVLLSWGRRLTNLTLERVNIQGAGTYGIQVDNETGSATISSSSIAGAASGAISNPNPAAFNLIRGPGNSGF